MKITYEIETTPQDTSGYNVPAYAEGRLEVRQAKTQILSVEGVLLVEFAIVLEQWRRQVAGGRMESLHYASMDFEEEPVFALIYDRSTGKFTPSSVFAAAEGSSISPSAATEAAASYIERLDRDLATRRISLGQVIDDALSSA